MLRDSGLPWSDAVVKEKLNPLLMEWDLVHPPSQVGCSSRCAAQLCVMNWKYGFPDEATATYMYMLEKRACSALKNQDPRRSK